MKNINALQENYGMAVTSAPSDKAEELALALVKEKLAACAQVSSPVKSCYWWKGKLETDEERLVFLKTTERKVPEIKAALSRLHPYEVPELIFLPAAGGNERYFSWIEETLS